MRRHRPFAIGILLGLLPLVAHAEPIAVVVGRANSVSSIGRSDVAAFYRGEALHWPTGKRVVLVNREGESPLREQFYRMVLRARADEQFYQAGTALFVRSVILRSDEAVLGFVATVDGAIGYVPASRVTDSVKVVLQVE